MARYSPESVPFYGVVTAESRSNCLTTVTKFRKALQQQSAIKRMAFALLISVSISVFLAWLVQSLALSISSSFVNLFLFAFGFTSYIYVEWLLSTDSERTTKAALLRDHWTAIATWAAYILVFLIFRAAITVPSVPAVKQVFLLVQIFGFVAVFALPVIAAYRASSMLYVFLRGLMVYSVALWLIGYGGDSFYKWVSAHPHSAWMGAASAVIVWMIIHFSGGLSRGGSSSVQPEKIARSSGTAAMTSGFLKPTARDNHYTAAHEAGHILLYAALGELPADVKIAVNNRPDMNGTLGFVTGISSNHCLDEKRFAEWQMLVLLAGQLGESLMYGESTMGSSDDHQRWLGIARSYLANHYRGVYYVEPQNRFEQAQNEKKLEALQAEQLGMLHTFFDLNAELFRRLTGTLLEARTMGRDDLLPFLSQVKLPEGFPVPFAPVETFAT